MTPDSPSAVLLSVHHWQSPQRAGFHHLASALHDLGWTVVFATVGLSPLSWLRGDPRCRFVTRCNALRLDWESPELGTFSWVTPWHPANLHSMRLNRASKPLVSAYAHWPLFGLRGLLQSSNLVVFESGPALLLTPRIRALARKARLVYRQSDAPDAVGFHPCVRDAERAYTSFFDLISVPDASRVPFFDADDPVSVHHHGVDAAAFDRATVNPYSGNGATNAVYVGMEGLDYGFIKTAAGQRPSWTFHIFGPWADTLALPNVTFHGLVPFSETVPYIKFADVALNCSIVPEGHLRTDTLKTRQYTFCRLPIIAEARVASTAPHVVSYAAGDPDSIALALCAAADYPRGAVPAETVSTWTQVAEQILDGTGLANV